MNRFSAALAIQAGACNPIAVARTLATAVDQCHQLGMDTAAICADPAVRLICHQLAYLLKISDIDCGLDTYHHLTLACEARAVPAGWDKVTA